MQICSRLVQQMNKKKVVGNCKHIEFFLLFTKSTALIDFFNQIENVFCESFYRFERNDSINICHSEYFQFQTVFCISLMCSVQTVFMCIYKCNVFSLEAICVAFAFIQMHYTA